ncbi:MAG: DUF385 domain-containing protein [SAR202 cluster bacterium]|nr:DUF385 domain-containing protein [SAR202 cluster bacterium]
MPDNDTALAALRKDRLIDITTTGRKTGQPRRIEIGFFIQGGKLYLTGRPGRRGWYANIIAGQGFTLHLKQSARLDLAATATPVRDPAARRRILTEYHKVLPRFASRGNLEDWITGSPLVEVTIPGVTNELGDQP